MKTSMKGSFKERAATSKEYGYLIIWGMRQQIRSFMMNCGRCRKARWEILNFLQWSLDSTPVSSHIKVFSLLWAVKTAAQGHRIYIFKVVVANFYNFVPVLATYGLSRSFEMAFTNCTFTYCDFAKIFLKKSCFTGFPPCI